MSTVYLPQVFSGHNLFRGNKGRTMVVSMREGGKERGREERGGRREGERGREREGEEGYVQ